MILVDSSIWIDHLRGTDAALSALLIEGRVLGHAFVVGEIALGSLRHRADILSALQGLPKAAVAEHDEVMAFIDQHTLFGRGIGYIDAHLLASVRLTADALLWTRDKRLHEIATTLAIAFSADATAGSG